MTEPPEPAAALEPLSTTSSIRALPAPTVRALSSSLTLTDPVAAVKELVDNALDAGATSVDVDVAANTIDYVSVRDNGRSVPPTGDDRALLGRRHCTSKLGDGDESRDVGGRTLGFRGEALASLAEVAAGVWVTVRCEGEGVASVLRIGRTPGEGGIEERKVGAPVGTTVRAEGFFERWPVRKQSALRDREKGLKRVSGVMQGYVLTRPGVRLQLRVGKGKGTAVAGGGKEDWVYAPKPGIAVGTGEERMADAVWKVVGKDTAVQCAYPIREVKGYTVEAFLPRSDAEGRKITGHGQFLSIDARPVSAARGTMKLIAKAFRNKLKKASPALEDMKEPFWRMDVKCPPGSYDPNVEPSKNDLLFDDAGSVLSAIEDFLDYFHSFDLQVIDRRPTEITEEEDKEAQMHDADEMSVDGDLFDTDLDIITAVAATANRSEDTAATMNNGSDLAVPNTDQAPAQNEQQSEEEPPRPKRQRTWKYNMYDFDEDDLPIGDGELEIAPDETIAEEAPEQEAVNDVAVSNPWTMAKMNARVRNSNPSINAQKVHPLADQTPSQLSLPTNTPPGPQNPLGKSHLLTPQPSSPTRDHNPREVRMADTLNSLHNSGPSAPSQSLAHEQVYHLPSPTSSLRQADNNDFYHDHLQQVQKTTAIAATSNSGRGRGRGGIKKWSGRGVINKPFRSPINPERDSWFSNLTPQRPKRSSVFLRRNEIPATTGGDVQNMASGATNGPLSDGRDRDIQNWMAGNNRRTQESSVASGAVVSEVSAPPVQRQSLAGLRGSHMRTPQNVPVVDYGASQAVSSDGVTQGRLTLHNTASSARSHQRSEEGNCAGVGDETSAEHSLRRSNRLIHRPGAAQAGSVTRDEDLSCSQPQQGDHENQEDQPPSRGAEPQRPSTGLMPLRQLSIRQQARRHTTSKLPLERVPEGAEMQNVFLVVFSVNTGNGTNNRAVKIAEKISRNLKELDPVANGLTWAPRDGTERVFGSEWGEVISPTVVQKWADGLGQLLTQKKPAGLEAAELREDISFLLMDAVAKQRGEVSACGS